MPKRFAVRDSVCLNCIYEYKEALLPFVKTFWVPRLDSSLIFCDYMKTLLSFGITVFANCAGAVSLSLRGAEDASTIRKTMPGKAVELSETVARRRRKFLRISTSGLYFIKENRHETSPPQANFFKDLRC